jgi:hypothetical protein
VTGPLRPVETRGGAPLGCVLRLEGDEMTYAYIGSVGLLRRLGACSSDDAARRAVER